MWKSGERAGNRFKVRSRKSGKRLQMEGLEKRNLLSTVLGMNGLQAETAEMVEEHRSPLDPSQATNADQRETNAAGVAFSRSMAPDAPTGLTAVATGPRSIFIDWNNVSSASTYKLERRTGTSGSFTQIYWASASSYTDSGNHLQPNTTYQYRVRATNSTGDSPYSNIVTVTTDHDIPDTPTGLSAEATGPRSVFIDWNNVSSASTYKLERRTGTSGSFTQIYWASASSYTDSGNHLQPNTTYQYRVRASNSTGDSPYSNIVTVTTDQDVPDTPTGLSAEATGPRSVFIDWNNVSSASTYKLERRTGTSGSFTQIYWASASSYTDSGNHLQPNTTYQYRVRATNSTGDSPYSNIVTVTTDQDVPDAPTGLTADSTGPTSVFIDWDNVATATTYKLERRTGTSGSFTQIYWSGPSEYTDSGEHLQPDTTYQYRVRANNSTGDSPYSAIVTVTTDQNVPDAPSGLTAVATGSQSIFIDWNIVPEASTYKLERRQGTSGSFKQIYWSGPSEYTDSGIHLRPDTTYQYRVRANNSAGDSDWSAIVTVTTDPSQAPPETPEFVALSPTGPQSIFVDWTDVPDTNIYELERRQGNQGSFTQIFNSESPTEFHDTGLLPQTMYQYRIRALNSGGASAYTTPQAVKTQAAVPDAPDGLTAVPLGPQTILLEWNSVAGAGSYKLERLEVGAGEPFQQIHWSNQTLYPDGGDHLAPVTTYQYRVRATNSSGDSAYSEVVSVTTPALSVPPIPVGVTATNGDFTDRVTINWEASDGADFYRVWRSTSNNPTKAIEITNATSNQTSFDDTSAQSGKVYWYWVTAENALGSSDFSGSDQGFTFVADTVGNSTATATSLGTLQSNLGFFEFVGTHDTADYFSFSLDVDANVVISLTGLLDDADVQLLSSSGSVIDSSTRGLASAEEITAVLNGGGDFFVRVYSFGDANTYYNLSIAGSSPDLRQSLPDVPDWASEWTQILENGPSVGIAYGIGEITRQGFENSNWQQLASRMHQLEGVGKIGGMASLILDVTDIAVDSVNVFNANSREEFAIEVNEWVRDRTTFLAGWAGVKAGAVVGGVIPGVGLIGAPLGAIFGGIGTSYAAGQTYDALVSEHVLEFARNYYDDHNP